MRKYIIGAIAGLMLSFAVGAHAEVIGLINKTVDALFPVTVDGKSLGDAIVVDNKTYLPVRDFGEATGYTVTFTEDRQVVLTKNEVTPPKPAPTSTADKGQKLVDLQKKLRDLEIEAEIIYKPIAGYRTLWAANPNLPESDEVKAARVNHAAKVAEIQAVMAEIEQIFKDAGL